MAEKTKTLTTNEKIAKFLHELPSVTKDCASPTFDHPLIKFASKLKPPIAVQDFVLRCCKFGQFSEETLIAAVILMSRVGPLPDIYTIHRLFGVSLMVACKLYEDIFWNNKVWARIIGVPLSELNRMEVDFLVLIKMRLFIDHHEYDRTLADVDRLL